MIRSRNSGVTNSPRRRVANCEILRVFRAVRQFSRRWRSSSSARRTRTVSISPAKRSASVNSAIRAKRTGCCGGCASRVNASSVRRAISAPNVAAGEGANVGRASSCGDCSTANAVVRRCSAPAMNSRTASATPASPSPNARYSARFLSSSPVVESRRRLTCSMAASSSALAASAAVAAASRTNASKRSSCRTAWPSRSRWQTGQGSPS